MSCRIMCNPEIDGRRSVVDDWLPPGAMGPDCRNHRADQIGLGEPRPLIENEIGAKEKKRTL